MGLDRNDARKGFVLVWTDLAAEKHHKLGIEAAEVDFQMVLGTIELR